MFVWLFRYSFLFYPQKRYWSANGIVQVTYTFKGQASNVFSEVTFFLHPIEKIIARILNF